MMRTLGLFGLVVLLLAVATLVVRYLRRRRDRSLDPVVLEIIWRRISAWWYLTAVLAAASLCGRFVTILLFGLLSFWSLREFITLTPTRRNDHRALFWMFFIFTPLQFILIGLDIRLGYLVFLPIAALLFVPIRLAIADDPKRFLERTTKLQFAMILCLFCLSYAPAILMLPIPGNTTAEPVVAAPQENPTIPQPQQVRDTQPSTSTSAQGGASGIASSESRPSSPLMATPPLPTSDRFAGALKKNTADAANSEVNARAAADLSPEADSTHSALVQASQDDLSKGEPLNSSSVIVTEAPEAPVEQEGHVVMGSMLDNGSFRLLFFLILIVQLGDSLQYAFSLLPNIHPIAAQISPGKTLEGLVGSTVCVALIGTMFCWATPYPFWYAALVSAGVAVIGFFGALAMSAVKRDRGVRDYGTLVEGHDGVLDRIDSLCFTAPYFYFMLQVWLYAQN
ncbi:MAG: phosphatidate cytidylyltransferase [Thermoguttaceae bacterium]|nr:phosphatidate cytidylyltransferase [Thermoguttaceae bacterium]